VQSRANAAFIIVSARCYLLYLRESIVGAILFPAFSELVLLLSFYRHRHLFLFFIILAH
jgi:hypothetical protein